MRVQFPASRYAPSPYGERPLDALDRASASGMIDLHADTPLHNLTLTGDGGPRWFTRIYQRAVDLIARFVPQLSNFHRHVTRDTLDVQQKGLQVFSTVTMGFPPAYRASHRLYTHTVAGWPAHANATPFNAFLQQVAWIYRERAKQSDRLLFAPDAKSAAAAIASGRVGVQISIEGAFPLELRPADEAAFRAFVDAAGDSLPPDMPLPSPWEIASLEGRLAYLRRLGAAYVGLNHLASSCYAGSSLWPNAHRDEGLSGAGARLVRQLDESGMLLDLAHASARGQRDVAAMVARGEYTLPLLVSHGLVQTPGEKLSWRMTLPETLDAVKQTGGVVAIMYARIYLRNGRSRDPEVLIGDICDQIDAVRRRIGVDCIALGGDADGFVGLPYPTLVETAAAVRRELVRRGYSKEDLSKIFGGNYLHALARRDAIIAGRADARRARALQRLAR